jgi:hypothetical protein
VTVVLKRHESSLVALHGHRLLVVGQQICRRTPDLAQSDIEGGHHTRGGFVPDREDHPKRAQARQASTPSTRSVSSRRVVVMVMTLSAPPLDVTPIEPPRVGFRVD